MDILVDLDNLASFGDMHCSGARTDLPIIEQVHPLGIVPGEGVVFCCHDQHDESVETFLIPHEFLLDEDDQVLSQEEIEPFVRELAEHMANATFN